MKHLSFFCLFSLICLASFAQESEINIYGLYYDFDLETEYLIELDPYTASHEVVGELEGVQAIALGTSTFNDNNHQYIFKGYNNSNEFKLYTVDAFTAEIIDQPTTSSYPDNFSIELEFDMKTGQTYGLQYDFENEVQTFVRVNLQTGGVTVLGEIPEIDGILLNTSTYDSNSSRYIFIGRDNSFTTRIYVINAIDGTVISNAAADYLGNCELQYDNNIDELFGIYREIPDSLLNDSIWSSPSTPLQIINIDEITGDYEVAANVDGIDAYYLSSSVYIQDSSDFVFVANDTAFEKRMFVVDVETGEYFSNEMGNENFIELKCDNTEFALRTYQSSNCESFEFSSNVVCYEDYFDVVLAFLGEGEIFLEDNLTGESYTTTSADVSVFGPYEFGSAYSFTAYPVADNSCSIEQTISTVSCTTTDLELLSFEATNNAEFNLLQWSTYSESELVHFVVEHSIDGLLFTEIEKVQAIGNSNIRSDYKFQHKTDQAGKHFYRLKAINGEMETAFQSNTIEVLRKNAFSIVVGPNPVENILNISYPIDQQTISVQIYSVSSQLIMEEFIRLSDSQNFNLDLSRLEAGIYFLRVLGNNGIEYQQKLVKN